MTTPENPEQLPISDAFTKGVRRVLLWLHADSGITSTLGDEGVHSIAFSSPRVSTRYARWRDLNFAPGYHFMYRATDFIERETTRTGVIVANPIIESRMGSGIYPRTNTLRHYYVDFQDDQGQLRRQDFNRKKLLLDTVVEGFDTDPDLVQDPKMAQLYEDVRLVKRANPLQLVSDTFFEHLLNTKSEQSSST